MSLGPRAPRAAKAALPRVQALYDAAGQGRRSRGWNPPSSGPNAAIKGLTRIRDRARDSARNDWSGESGVQKWTTNLVGTGIVPRWADATVGPLWNEFVTQADADGVLDLYGMQTLATRTWLDSGEVFLRRRPRSLALPLSAPMQVQLIEADFVPLFDTSTWPGMPVGNIIRQGIELNVYGRRVAYWMYKAHPGDQVPGVSPSPLDLIRVLASDVSHMFEPKRPGQLRGVSMLAPVLMRLRSAVDYEDAVLDRQKLANLFTMLITRQLPDDLSDVPLNPDTGLPKMFDNDGTPMAGLEPGISQTLRPGENVVFSNPPEAGTTYSDYLRTTGLGTAAGQGLPYELHSGDILNVSDRTLRVVVNEFRRFAEQRQWQIVIPQFCRPVVNWWADALVLGGSVSLRLAAQIRAPEWSPQGWEYLHPVQDVQGKIAARDAGFISTSQIISQRGDDPQKVLEQIKKDKASGLTPEPVVAPVAAKPVVPDEPPARRPGDTPQALSSERFHDGVLALLASQATRPAPAAAPVVAETSALEKTFLGLASLLATSQQENAALHKAFADIAQALVDRPINVEAPVVTVSNEVSPTPLQVNVVNEVQPAEVDVTLRMPSRRSETEVERDHDNQITRSVTTETTIQ